MATKKSMTLKEGFDRLDEIIQKLESSDISLEDSFDNYKKGMDVLKECNKVIDTIEKKVVSLQINEDKSEE